ncbi:hypothetical protein EELLY_v1c05270 [Entomoplasma ellychniae]|uniref:Folate family ECF transporter S component n=1 Tax=Entomoplasma ellychniae TaxID=2114 RepID=A0A8E2UAT6_9MOLU|nr:folate family ECF transporter S component [Entomoplasma ellychniae]PPE04846.1 hypothetical protein EELLY_v1c05270 [Entomoplasma ellychniae]
MFYTISNICFLITVLLLIITTTYWQRLFLRRVSIKNIVIIGMFVALSIVLTNFIGYGIRILGIQMMLGNFIIFTCGVLFGPFFGIVSGFCSDLTGSLLFIGSSFHFGYMLSKVLLGFFGGLVFLPQTNKLWKLRLVLYLCVGLMISSLVITPISLASVNGWEYVLLTFPKKLIIIPSQTIVYSILSFSTLNISYILLKSEANKISRPWFLKNQKIKVRS